MLWTKDFWKAARDRAIRTFAQSAVAVFPTSTLLLNEVDWVLIGSSSLLAAILSVLNSVATSAKNPGGDISVNESVHS